VLPGGGMGTDFQGEHTSDVLSDESCGASHEVRHDCASCSGPCVEDDVVYR